MAHRTPTDDPDSTASLRARLAGVVPLSVEWTALRDERLPGQFGVSVDPATLGSTFLTLTTAMATVMYTMYDRRATEVNNTFSEVSEDLYRIMSGEQLIGRGTSVTVDWTTAQPWHRGQVSTDLQADLIAFERDLRAFQTFDAELEGELRAAIRESDADTAALLPDRLTRTTAGPPQYKNACRADNLDGQYIQDVEWLHLCGPALFDRESPAQLREAIRSQIADTGAARDFNIDFWDRLDDSWADHLHHHLATDTAIRAVLADFASAFHTRRERRAALVSEAERLRERLQAEMSRWYPRLFVDVTGPADGFTNSTAAVVEPDEELSASGSPSESSVDRDREPVLERG